MLIRSKITLLVEGEKKRLNLSFHNSFTRIAVGADDGKTNSGFTKYFRQLKKTLELRNEADDFIFIFSIKEWEKRREEILHAQGKVIIVDNAGLTLFADEEMKDALDRGNILDDNQWIVKDWKDDDGGDPLLYFLNEEFVGWLTEVKRQDVIEVRLTYKEKLTALGQGKWLFTSREAIEEYGLEYMAVPRDTENDGTDEFDVVDVSAWDTETIQEYFKKVPKARIYSKCLLDDDIIKACNPIITDTELIKRTFYMKSLEWDKVVSTKLFYNIKMLATEAKLLGPLKYAEVILGETMLYLWKSKEQNQLFATVVLSPNFQHVTYNITLFDPVENGRYSLRVSDNSGLTDGDILLLMKACFITLGSTWKSEGLCMWDLGVS